MIKKMVPYMFMLVLIFISVSPLLSSEIKALLVFLFTTILLIHNKYVIKTIPKSFILLIIFSFIVIMIDLFNVNSLSSIELYSFYVPLTLFFGLLLSRYYSLEEFVSMFGKIVLIITLFSFISVAIYTFYPGLVNNLITYKFYHLTHKTAILFNILLTDGFVVKRNTGIAWEPGLFQMLLNMGLYFTIKYDRGRYKHVKTLIYAIAILTTKSTTGLILLAIIILSTIKFNKKFLWVVLILLISFPFTKDLYIDYVINKGIGSEAFDTRFLPFMDGVKAGLRYPFGLGNVRFKNYFLNMQPPWESIGQMFSRYGVFFSLIFLTTLIYNNKKRILLIAIFILTFLAQTIWLSPIVTFFLFIEDECENDISFETKLTTSDIGEKESFNENKLLRENE